MKLLTTKSDADQIAAYLAGKVAELTPALERKLKRMEAAGDLVRKHGSVAVVAKMLLRLAEYTDLGSKARATVYRDIEDAMDVLGSTVRKSRDFYVDALLEREFKSYDRATEAQDWRAVAAIGKNIAGLIKDFLGGKEAIDWSKIQPPRLIVGFMPELLNVPLPADLDAQVAQLLKAKKHKSLSALDFEEAQVVN